MPAPAVLLVTDNRGRSADLAPLLADKLQCVTIDLGDPVSPEAGTHKAVIFDVDLGDSDAAQRLRRTISGTRRDGVARIFVAERSHHARVQAAALGSEAVLVRPLNPEKLFTAIFGPPAEPAPVIVLPEVSAASTVAAKTMTASFDAVQQDAPLDFSAVANDGDQIDDAVMKGEITQWITAVRQHHSYTYRHCMLVAGVTAAFTQHLGIGGPCRQRLMRGALLHDIGKAGIPLTILDKPDKLTEAELTIMRRHPAIGRDFLLRHHKTEKEVIDIVYGHHEMIDGTGYPEGIRGDRISDAVRIITICDVYAALIEPRAYKKQSSKQEAFDLMEQMGDKLDRDLLRAFKPIALA